MLEAWPKSLKYSDMDAQSSDIFIETLELAFEGTDLEDAGSVNLSLVAGLGLAGITAGGVGPFP